LKKRWLTAFHLRGMITVKDFQKAERKPNACKDEHGRLRVGAAVGAGAGNEERVDALVAAGVDVLLIDSSRPLRRRSAAYS
jgi:IMP dehydrogenase